MLLPPLSWQLHVLFDMVRVPSLVKMKARIHSTESHATSLPGGISVTSETRRLTPLVSCSSTTSPLCLPLQLLRPELTPTNVLQPGQSVYVLLYAKRSQLCSRAGSVCLEIAPLPLPKQPPHQRTCQRGGRTLTTQFIFNGAVFHRVRHLECNWKVAVAEEVQGEFVYRTETVAFPHLSEKTLSGFAASMQPQTLSSTDRGPWKLSCWKASMTVSQPKRKSRRTVSG